MNNLAFLFPGQGSQFVGMGKQFWNDFVLAKRLFEEASDAISLDVKKLCFNGDMNELTKTMNAQPAILTVSVIAFQVYMQEIGVEPRFLAGHSLGEYSALVCAGALSFQDAVTLVRERGILMQNADPHQQGTMAAVTQLSLQTLQEICSKVSTEDFPAGVACMNSEQQHVISGHRQAVERVIKMAEEKGAAYTYLNVSAPFHSSMIRSASEQFQTVLHRYSFRDAAWPVISNVTARPYSSGNSISEHLKQHMTMPVRWTESMHYLLLHGVTEVIEMGPNNVLAGLLRKTTNHIVPYPLGQTSDVHLLSNSAERKKHIVRLRKKQLNKLMIQSVIARNYNKDSAAYSNMTTPLFTQIQELKERMKRHEDVLSEQELEHSIHLCKLICEAKQLPDWEELRILK
ncbi:bacillomycin D biosynthesis malonyl-CoA transacylase BamD [Bacillus sp. ICE1]|uniref:bacillomycin D biosynthesis malonyl-CoA transacylase BamD n=1 Tax=Bacillus TaxID=1386 RepID=UPI001E572D03|nr:MULTISPECIES: bacillomycin D biosynthesis malonyl-CoA transacylase BamD [unclassified Bacillus (in: firmicutes)]MCC8303485.1 bacillomycin D biosynthesis malonyl-CoA transacylase BamD [Bacillus sp. AF12]MDV9079565.1 bacillomycin D biosynthesis malonyl-CoA transacylase BamD [Bacillus sp. ICE1]